MRDREPGSRWPLPGGLNGSALAICAASLGALATSALAQARVTQAEALRLAFPAPLEIERKTAFLSEDDLEAARRVAGEDVDIEVRVVTYYVATSASAPVGVAYFDAHRVRTLPEVLMIVVTPEAQIDRVEILKFSEPPEYRAPETWLQQLHGHELSEALSLKGSVINMTGATLTSRAVVRASRRVLALHQIIQPFAAADGESAP